MIGSVYLSIYNKLSEKEQNDLIQKVKYEEERSFEESSRKDHKESRERR